MAFEMYEMRLPYEMVCIPISRIQDVFGPDTGRVRWRPAAKQYFVRASSSRISAGSWTCFAADPGWRVKRGGEGMKGGGEGRPRSRAGVVDRAIGLGFFCRWLVFVCLFSLVNHRRSIFLYVDGCGLRLQEEVFSVFDG